MTTAQLLLTADRLAQFQAALGDGGLETLIEESQAYVAQMTRSYTVEQTVLDGFVRTLTLYRAHLVVESAVPEDLRTAYDSVMRELRDIAAGKQPLPPATADTGTTPAASGRWGGQTRLAMRGDPAT